MKLSVSGKLGGKSVTATWENGGLTGDPTLIRKMLDVAMDKLYIDMPPPDGLTPIKISSPVTFVPLARLALDEVIAVDDGQTHKPDRVY